MDIDLAIVVEIIIAINAVALFIVGAMLISFRRTIDMLRRMDESLLRRVSDLEIDTAGLKEWRTSHDLRHVELLTEIRDMKTLLMRLVTRDFFDGATSTSSSRKNTD